MQIQRWTLCNILNLSDLHSISRDGYTAVFGQLLTTIDMKFVLYLTLLRY
jgi:hypothetical protein